MAKYNQKTVDNICKLLEEGCLQKQSAILSGVGETTFYEWMKVKPKFRESVERAIETYKQKLIKLVNAHSITDGRLAIDMLERRFPDEYGKVNKVQMLDPHAEIKKMFDRIKDDYTKIADVEPLPED